MRRSIYGSSYDRLFASFLVAVEKHIQPKMLSWGFSEGAITDYEIVFTSRKVDMDMSFAPISHEIDVVFQRHGDSEEYDLADMVAASTGQDAEDQSAFQASSVDSISHCVREIGNLLEEYGQGALHGDPLLYSKMSAVRDARGEAGNRRYVYGPLREQAVRAWRDRKYPEVVHLYEKIPEEELTPVEIKKLEYARRLTMPERE